MVESKILKLLQQKALEVINDNKFVKCLNVNYNPPANKRWWEVVYIPNNVENEFWDTGKTYKGIFRLILHWPQNNQGIYKPMEEAERVAKGFPKGLKLCDTINGITVTIIEQPDCQNIIESEGELLIGLTIKYLYFTL